MTHPMVLQLRFARSEFRRGLEGTTDEDARKRLMPMNSISWMIGHLAWQEQRYWLQRAQDQVLVPRLNQEFSYGGPPTTPPLEEIWHSWEEVIAACDPWLDRLDDGDMQRPLRQGTSSVGTFMHRTIYHYWYHLGEALAVRQMLGHSPLPDFVGNIDVEAPYRPDSCGIRIGDRGLFLHHDLPFRRRALSINRARSVGVCQRG